MAERGRKRQILHKQARKMVHSVHDFFKREADAGMPIIDVAKCRERTAKACDISVKTVGRIAREAQLSLNESGSVKFESPGKCHKRKKPVRDMDAFDKDVLRRKVFDMYDKGEFPTAKKLVAEMRQAVGYAGGVRSMYRILKDIGFKYMRCKDGRKFLLERSDITAARVKFLRTMQNIRQEKKIYNILS